MQQFFNSAFIIINLRDFTLYPSLLMQYPLNIMRYPSFLTWTPFFLVFLLCCTACNADQNKLQKLEGHWVLNNAEDNELNIKDRLQGVFFQYSQDGGYTTNFSLTGDTSGGKFLIKEDKITLQSAEPITFTVQDWKDSTMQLVTNLRGHEFKLWVQKQ